MNSRHLIIFVKNPEPGKVKTRLAATLGNEKAVAIYRELLAHTEKVTSSLNLVKKVYYGDYINVEDIWDNVDYYKALQEGDSLGERMSNAFEHAFEEGADEVVIIGSDCPEINKETIEKAFDSLLKNDVVIGPAEDGGYYLLGMNKFTPELFRGKKWSTSSVLNDTLKDTGKLQLSVTLLDMYTDIDEEADLQRFSWLKDVVEAL
ncbi:TIGR04282 family arsenosugar biosynthesis glycosyltransferase [Limibacter armeniacum]|uniref:TIGR04282 family arsenosugar biosynthesis glycosyltransferase n=1 Tax=Limibacter armeniacum TaxID=466084 RepID=UPI002FE58B7F